VRLFSFDRIRKFIERLRDILHINPGLIRLLRFLAMAFIWAHWSACIFFSIAVYTRDEYGPNTWIDEYKVTGGGADSHAKRSAA
jgi:hypothetical protein